MKRIIPLLTVLFLSSLSLGAQTDYALEVTDSITSSCAFNKVEILDVRNYKEDMGYIRTGPFNAKNLLVPKAGAAAMISKFIDDMTGNATDPRPRTLLLVLRDFKITDRPVAGEMGAFYARINFYLGADDKFLPLFTVDSFFETANGWDVTKSIKRLASKKMTEWTKQAALALAPSEDASGRTTTELLQALSEEHKKHLVYTEAPKKGVFYTYEQFLSNTPADTGFVERHWKTDGYETYTFYTRKENGKKGDNLDKVNCFAIYNGSKWFKKTSLGLYEMKFKDGDFYFPETGRGLRANDDMAVMFGLVGALLTNPDAKTKGAIYRLRYDPDTNGGQFVERLQ